MSEVGPGLARQIQTYMEGLQGRRADVPFDMAALENATGRQLREEQRAKFMEVQHQANRWTYIGSGMSHPKFLEALQDLSPERRTLIEKAAPSFS